MSKTITNNAIDSTVDSITSADYDLFNNPMIDSARKAMKSEDLERYAKLGEALYKDIDFETGLIVEQYPDPMSEALAYVQESLKSGQHPSTLTDEEKDLLVKMVGETWFEEWGYTTKDLESIQ